MIWFDFIIYLFTFRKRGREGGKQGRETLMCGCLSHAPNQGPDPQPRHVPWLGIEPVTIRFAGRQSVPWAAPARAEQNDFNRSIMVKIGKFNITHCYLTRILSSHFARSSTSVFSYKTRSGRGAAFHRRLSLSSVVWDSSSAFPSPLRDWPFWRLEVIL